MKSGDFFCHTYLNFTLKIYLYSNIPLEHSTRTTSRMTAIEWTTTEIRTTTRTARTTRTTLTCLLASEEIQAIYHMKHRIAVNGIILGIRTGCGRNGNWNVMGAFMFNCSIDCAGVWNLNTDTNLGYNNYVSYLSLDNQSLG